MERDLRRSFADRVVLAHELVQARVAKQAVPLLVDVHAVRRAWSLAVEEYAEGDRLSRSTRQSSSAIEATAIIGTK